METISEKLSNKCINLFENMDGTLCSDTLSLNVIPESKTTILFFYPEADTPVCNSEMKALSTILKDLKDNNIMFYVLSNDTMERHSKVYDNLKINWEKHFISVKNIPDIFKCSRLKPFVKTPITNRLVVIYDKYLVLRYFSMYSLYIGRSMNEILRIANATNFATGKDLQTFV